MSEMAVVQAVNEDSYKELTLKKKKKKEILFGGVDNQTKGC